MLCCISVFPQVWNDTWVAMAEEDNRMYGWLLGVSGAAYTASLVLAGKC
jgi:hypothetical protein